MQRSGENGGADATLGNEKDASLIDSSARSVGLPSAHWGTMKDLPNPFWAGLFILFACVVSIIALRIPTQANATMAVIAIASNIVSGSFGFISGQLAARNSVQVPLNDPTQPPTTTTVSVTPTAPLPPPQG